MSTAPDGIRSIQFRLRRDHYEALTAALVEHGATVGRRGLEGKEDALMRLLRQDRATSRKLGKAPVCPVCGPDAVARTVRDGPTVASGPAARGHGLRGRTHP